MPRVLDKDKTSRVRSEFVNLIFIHQNIEAIQDDLRFAQEDLQLILPATQRLQILQGMLKFCVFALVFKIANVLISSTFARHCAKFTIPVEAKLKGLLVLRDSADSAEQRCTVICQVLAEGQRETYSASYMRLRSFNYDVCQSAPGIIIQFQRADLFESSTVGSDPSVARTDATDMRDNFSCSPGRSRCSNAHMQMIAIECRCQMGVSLIAWTSTFRRYCARKQICERTAVKMDEAASTWFDWRGRDQIPAIIMQLSWGCILPGVVKKSWTDCYGTDGLLQAENPRYWLGPNPTQWAAYERDMRRISESGHAFDRGYESSSYEEESDSSVYGGRQAFVLSPSERLTQLSGSQTESRSFALPNPFATDITETDLNSVASEVRGLGSLQQSENINENLDHIAIDIDALLTEEEVPVDNYQRRRSPGAGFPALYNEGTSGSDSDLSAAVEIRSKKHFSSSLKEGPDLMDIP